MYEITDDGYRGNQGVIICAKGLHVALVTNCVVKGRIKRIYL